MPKVIGRTGSWMWWALGCLCALAFAPRGAGAEPAPPNPPDGRLGPPVELKEATPEQVKAAGKLVDDYLAPVAAGQPTVEQKTAIDAALKELAAGDFARREAASAALVKIGPAALGALREAAQSKDPEVVTRAGTAAAAVENAARGAIVEDLKKNPAARTTISRRQTEARAAQFKAMREVDEARKAGRADEATAKAAEAKAAAAKSAALTALMSAVFPGRDPGDRMVPVYGIRPRLEQD